MNYNTWISKQYMTMKTIAIIPARGGSKRIKKKNIRLFFNKPIILYTIEALIASNIFSKVHVSTEDNEIFNLITNYGIKPDFMRPKKLSNDETPIIEVIDFVVKEYSKIGEKFDQIWLVMPCNPFLEKDIILNAKEVFEKNCSDKALLAIKETTSFSKLLTLKSNNIIKPIDKKNFQVQSQNLTKTYIDAGSFAIFSYKFLIENNSNLFPRNFYGYELKKSNAIDIDDEYDWNLAEAIYYLKNKDNEK